MTETKAAKTQGKSVVKPPEQRPTLTSEQRQYRAQLTGIIGTLKEVQVSVVDDRFEEIRPLLDIAGEQLGLLQRMVALREKRQNLNAPVEPVGE
jgi:hypothetical protein